MDILTEGYALPVAGGFYPKPPYLYRGAKAIIALYEADPARIAELLPPGVAPLEDPPVCIAWVVHYPFSTLGVYNETIMLIRVSFEGEPYTFCPFIYVDNDAALACGRELWGFP
ncbi:MAG TPA: acetoacetate decarboxylase family protein, partial [Streptosporangiaceae bacterium]